MLTLTFKNSPFIQYITTQYIRTYVHFYFICHKNVFISLYNTHNIYCTQSHLYLYFYLIFYFIFITIDMVYDKNKSQQVYHRPHNICIYVRLPIIHIIYNICMVVGRDIWYTYLYLYIILSILWYFYRKYVSSYKFL